MSHTTAAPFGQSPLSVAAREPSWDPRALATLMVTTAAGVLLVALAFDGARRNHGWSDALFWTSLLVVFLPIAFRLTGRRAARGERMCLVIVVGLALYAVKVLLEPNTFTLHDELGQYRSVADVLRTGRLYITNPVVPAYSFYPGLLTATAALSKLSGLGIFTSGVMLIGVARVLLTGGLFLLLERVSDSPRIAGLAVLIYAANPNFAYFDSAFAYESLALGLGALTLWAAARVFDASRARPPALVLAGALDVALILSHHLTSYVVAVAILIWAALEILRRRSWRETGYLGLLAVFCAGATAAYAVWSWPATQSDIGGSITGSIHGLFNVLTGGLAGKHPYTSVPGYPNPLLEQIVGILSVALLLVALPWALYALWRRPPRDIGLLILGGCALLYPVSLALRLTSAGSETSNRTSEFVFVGLGAILAVTFVARLGSRAASRRIAFLPARLLATLYLGLVFVGGITVGNPLYQLIPGNFEVAASNRSVDPEGVQAAHWANRLPPGSAFLANQTDEELVTAYTQLTPQHGLFDGIGIGELFTAPSIGPLGRAIIAFDKLHFLIVDKRDSTMLPADGDYFGGSDAQTYRRPIPLASLTKFSHSRCIDQVFSSGNILIFDTGPLFDGCR